MDLASLSTRPTLLLRIRGAGRPAVCIRKTCMASEQLHRDSNSIAGVVLHMFEFRDRANMFFCNRGRGKGPQFLMSSLV